jgi:hypothetical protein
MCVKLTDLLDLRPILGHLILVRHDAKCSCAETPKSYKYVSLYSYSAQRSRVKKKKVLEMAISRCECWWTAVCGLLACLEAMAEA